MTGDARFEQWVKWLETIYQDIQGLLTSRHIYREVQAIIAANPKIHQSSSFYEWMAVEYVVSTVIGVRRQVDPNSRSVSFLRLLQDIIRNPQVLSRKRYLALCAGYSADFGNDGFDEIAGYGLAHIDPVKVCAQLTELNSKAASIKKYANKRIVHHDQSDFRDLPTYGEVDACLDCMEEL